MPFSANLALPPGPNRIQIQDPANVAPGTRSVDLANVAVAAGCSGHGFKFAPVVGRAIADLMCDGHTELPVGFLSPGRPGI